MGETPLDPLTRVKDTLLDMFVPPDIRPLSVLKTEAVNTVVQAMSLEEQQTLVNIARFDNLLAEGEEYRVLHQWQIDRDTALGILSAKILRNSIDMDPDVIDIEWAKYNAREAA
ncbi:MAG: hypothetical protein JWL85_97 [Candidatus Saccharibacteria bacterium]|nr:hypothetical protein [Candidatus Saccharibacteria bacterium]